MRLGVSITVHLGRDDKMTVRGARSGWLGSPRCAVALREKMITRLTARC